MKVREMRPADEPAVQQMMRALWPEAASYDFRSERVFVWEEAVGKLGGFVSISLRMWAEGCDSEPVPYVEGWWVEPALRRRGIGRALIAEVERWCVAHGHRELGSDAELENAVSLTTHAALGFKPTLRLQFFRKLL
jgi:aminoglycoside 6'-N-acetyltransferase I